MDLSILEASLRAMAKRKAEEAEGRVFPEARDIARHLLHGPRKSSIPAPKGPEDRIRVAKEIGHKAPKGSQGPQAAHVAKMPHGTAAGRYWGAE